ncbi:reverse transcriptase domain-containing protein [Tanacetum coccineum]
MIYKDIEADDEERRRAPTPGRHCIVALPATDQALYSEETEPFETDESVATTPPHPAYRVTAKIFIPAPVPTPVWSDAEVSQTSVYLLHIITHFPPWSSLTSPEYLLHVVGRTDPRLTLPPRRGLVSHLVLDLGRKELISAAARPSKRPRRNLSEIEELRTADHTRQQQLIQTLTGQVTALQGQQGPIEGPAQPIAAEEACQDATYAMTWADLRKKMTDKYCPRNEMKKLEAELWNLKVKGTDVIGYNQRFQELALLCVRMFPEESDKIERYVGGLPDMIHGNIVASKPKTMQEAVEMATELMDKKVITIAERQAENKRKFENTSRNNQNQQQQNKRQNTGRAYTAGTGEKKPYGGSKPLCAKCNYHHDGPCAPKCHKCNKFGHFSCDCRSLGNANNATNQGALGLGQNLLAFE